MRNPAVLRLFTVRPRQTACREARRPIASPREDGREAARIVSSTPQCRVGWRSLACSSHDPAISALASTFPARRSATPDYTRLQSRIGPRGVVDNTRNPEIPEVFRLFLLWLGLLQRGRQKQRSSGMPTEALVLSVDPRLLCPQSEPIIPAWARVQLLHLKCLVLGASFVRHMVRVALTLYLMLSTVAAPLLCCCAAEHHTGHITPSSTGAARHHSCCQQHYRSGQQEQAPEGKSDQDSRPGRSPCPCKDQNAQFVPLLSSPPEGAEQSPGQPLQAWRHLFLSLPATVQLSGFGSPLMPRQATGLPFLTAQDFLRALHILRC
jgi:hypothetical protein